MSKSKFIEKEIDKSEETELTIIDYFEDHLNIGDHLVPAIKLTKMINKLVKHGIDVKTYNHRFVPGLSTGYYCSDSNEIAISLKHDPSTVLQTFIHEYCHFLQDLEGMEIWKESTNGYYYEQWENWLSSFNKSKKRMNKKVEKRFLKHALPVIKAIEADAEKRALDIVIKHFDNFICPVNYIKRANCYIAFHDVMALTKRFYNTSVYECNELMKLVPDEYIIDGLDDVDKKHEFIYYCIKNCM